MNPNIEYLLVQIEGLVSQLSAAQMANTKLIEESKLAVAVLTEGKTCTGSKAVAVNILRNAISQAEPHSIAIVA